MIEILAFIIGFEKVTSLTEELHFWRSSHCLRVSDNVVYLQLIGPAVAEGAIVVVFLIQFSLLLLGEGLTSVIPLHEGLHGCE